MAGGQAIDLAAGRQRARASRGIELMHRRKTGALIDAQRASSARSPPA